MNEIIEFQFNGNGVRTIKDESGEIWFVAKDVCDILELRNVGEALKGLDDDELTSELLMSGGQNREMKIISESGLYSLIFRSRKPEARQFRKWVTSDVLPTIRKTGGYRLDGGPVTGLDYRDEYIAVLKEKIQWLNTSPHAGPVTPEEEQAMQAAILSGMTTAEVARKYGRAREV